MVDSETGETILVDTTSAQTRMEYEKYYVEQVKYFSETFSRSGAGVITTRVDESYVKKMLNYFKSR